MDTSQYTAQLGASLGAAWVNGQRGVLVRDAEKLRHLGRISRAWHQRWGGQEEQS